MLDSGSTNRRLMLASTALALLLPPAMAVAADPPPSASDQPVATAPAQAASSPAQGVTTIEAIVVTARKREERLVDVPVAASVLSTDRINEYAATDLESIGNLVPGVSFQRSGGGGPGATLSIRGVGNLAVDYGTEQPVAMTRGHAIDISQFDLADVQILKGPQSLYFGKDSPAGVVAIDSQNPGDTFSGYFTGQHEFVTDTWAGEGAVTIPVNDTLSFRIAGRISDMFGGYVRNNAQPIADPFPAEAGLILPGAAYPLGPGTRTEAIRATAEWKPNSEFTAVLKVLYSDYWDRTGAGDEEVGACGPGVTHPSSYGVPDPFQGCTIDRVTSIGEPPQQIAAGFYPGQPEDKPFNHSATNVDTLTLTYRFPKVTLTSVTGFYHQYQDDFDDFDDTVYAQAIDYQYDTDNTFSEEFRAATTFAGPINFTVGAFFEYETLSIWGTDKIAPTGPFGGVNYSGQPLYEPIPSYMIGEYNSTILTESDKNTTESVFGEADWKILPTLDLAGGARWTHEHKTTDIGNLFDIFDYLLGPVNPGNPFSPGGVRYYPTVDEDNVSPEVTLTWHPVQNTTLYGAFKTGFLSGGSQNSGGISNIIEETGSYVNGVFVRNIAAEDAALEYQPETVEGGEVGAKGLLFDGKLNADLTFYDYNYKNLQVEVFNSATTTFSLHNAGSALNRGVELNLTVSPLRDLTVHTSVEYSFLKYISYPGAACYDGETLQQGCVNNQQDLSGTRYGGPPVSTDLGLNYQHPFIGQFRLAFSVDWFWYDTGFMLERQANTEAQAYSSVNAAVRLFKPGAHWEVAILGTNIFNADPWLGGGDVPLGSPGEIGGVAIPPAEVTAQFTYHW